MRLTACRLFLAAALIALSVIPAAAQDDPVKAGWAIFRDRFLTEDGRIRDTGNKDVSHTEGQGWAMLCAEAADDPASFEKIWGWTRSNLQRRDNALFSWRWDPDGKTPVADRNNASDGDTLIAWSLIRAGRHWNRPDYTQAAHRIVMDIRKRLLVVASGRLMLLPGINGFKETDGALIINPSYYVYPALKDFAQIVPGTDWPRLRRDGVDLLAEARFGRWGLPADWLQMHRADDPIPAPNYPPRFGYEAIRIPLYLIWGGEATGERLASYLDFWNDLGKKPAPAWTDVSDNKLAPFAGPTGFQAIVQLTRDFGQPSPVALPSIGDKDDYYSASLTLLAAIAQRETSR